MIISCPKCKKKFEVQDNLIPNEGRLLQCSSCKNKWFYKNDIEILVNETKKKDKTTKENKTVLKNEIPSEIERIINDAEESSTETPKKIKKESIKTNQQVPFFNIFLVAIICFISLIIVFDTFKKPLDNLIPGFNFMLNNFYESLNDLFLFFKDLIK